MKLAACIVIAVLIGFIGVYIGKQQASTPVAAQHKTTHKTTPKKEKPTPPVTQEETMAEKVSDFSAQVMPVIDNITNDITQIGSYARQGTADPSIVNDVTYRDNIRMTCMNLAAEVEKLREVPEPTDPGLDIVWNTMQPAIDDMDYVASNYVTDVENMNTQDLTVVADKMGEAGQIFLLMKQQISNLLTK